MPMKRRGFVKGLLVTPAVPLLAHQTQTPSAPAAPPPAAPRPVSQAIPNKLAMVEVDSAAQTTQHYFKPEQFAALEKLGDVLVPPMQGKPGAVQAGAPVFLDFLISESPADRQKLYQHGLDGLNLAAHKHFSRSFGELDAAQAGTILKPLLVARFWPQDMPEDPMQHFVAQVHEDLQTATTNSREWAETGKRGFNRAAGLYWNPIDPVVKG